MGLDVKRMSGKTHQFLATCVACLGSFTLGTVFVWTAPALPGLEKTIEFKDLTPHEISWIASLIYFGGLVSGPFAGLAMNFFGRRGSLIWVSIPCALAWLCIGLGPSVYFIYVGRFVLGCCIGSYAIFINVYIAEIAEDHIRGMLGFIYPISTSMGVLYTYIVGTFCSWRVLTLTNAVYPLGLLVGMCLMPESPIFLLEKGRDKDARIALQWFRSATNVEQIENVFHEIRVFVEKKTVTPNVKINVKDYFESGVFKPILITLGLLLAQQLSGVNVILSFAVEIFKNAGSNLDPNVSTIVLGAFVLLSCCLSIPFSDKVGRRVLLFTSAAGMSLALGSMGTFVYFKEHRNLDESFHWIPLVCLLVFIIALNWGYGPIPWLMIGELIPSHVKGGASAVVATFGWFFSFVMIKTFEDLKEFLGMPGVYWLFSGCCFVSSIFSFYIVPETRGKTLAEIEGIFK